MSSTSSAHDALPKASLPFNVAIYMMGKRYVAARSNEFTYANYEIESVR